MHRLSTAAFRLVFLAALGFWAIFTIPLAGDDTIAKASARPTEKGLMVNVTEKFDEEAASLEQFYKTLHTTPELSLQEVRTAGRLTEQLTTLGFKVTKNFGATGIVGVFTNGKGPTLLVRTDMDALPVTERTGLPYASKARARDKNGNEVGVMHACGHDMHMTVWVGVARVLVALKDRWKGTLVFIGQPAEEIGTGARLMLEAGLYKKFPKPDYCLALHCDAQRAHGTVGYTEGLAMANVDSVDITVRGKGGHGAAPHTTVDPIVLAARIILDLQTLVSRETNPTDPAVVTVGSIHGGTKHNIIPDEVKLQITVRSTKDKVRKNLLSGIKRVAEGCARAANAPEPVVKIDDSEFTPALHNNPELTKRVVAVLKETLGAKNVEARPPVLGGEDFSRYGQTGVPIFMFWLGTIAPERVAAAEKEGAKPLPSMHSDQYYPVPTPTLRTGVKAMSMAALDLLGK